MESRDNGTTVKRAGDLAREGEPIQRFPRSEEGRSARIARWTSETPLFSASVAARATSGQAKLRARAKGTPRRDAGSTLRAHDPRVP